MPERIQATGELEAAGGEAAIASLHDNLGNNFTVAHTTSDDDATIDHPSPPPAPPSYTRPSPPDPHHIAELIVTGAGCEMANGRYLRRGTRNTRPRKILAFFFGIFIKMGNAMRLNTECYTSHHPTFSSTSRSTVPCSSMPLAIATCGSCIHVNRIALTRSLFSLILIPLLTPPEVINH